ncbi:MucR family transcriptional regulator [Methylobacterium sp. J-076]|uniref:MucR family transcriptional regulator n=1 Tax=Methylobacterium sp. J-076 TaxID=2836655 RepID=UPI001FBBAAA4|nr:MucR family transcriptional regulator [Methylobacterium sp. J-076]MCJ2012222.1 MucR family transcriptional regulator [Methylobacterium sp. J-076]
MAENVLDQPSEIEGCVTAIVGAYVSGNHVAAADVPGLIACVHAALTTLAAREGAARAACAHHPTEAQIEKSVQRDGLVSFLDGKSYKTLKRHLRSHGLDPRSYRDHFGLPFDYPMVAPAYREKRSAIAKVTGLGVSGSRPGHEVLSAPPPERQRHTA